jgi:rhodanese-related sulfurtransferase
MENIEKILATAAERAQVAKLPYAGALLPQEAFELMRNGGALLVDVRTKPEWDYVGRATGSQLIEWQSYPSSLLNPSFLTQLQAEVGKDKVVMFMCRSGARSSSAAKAAAAAGYTKAYNVLQGFEGDKDASGHRSTVGGWRLAGLPWTQG